MTKEQLAEIKARCDKATPNPHLMRYDHGGGRSIVEGETPKDGRKLVADFYHIEDREFYHNARTDIPELLTEISRLKTLLVARPPDDSDGYCFFCSNAIWMGPSHPENHQSTCEWRLAKESVSA